MEGGNLVAVTEKPAPSLGDVKINERVVVWRLVNGEKRRVRFCELLFSDFL